MSRLPNLIHRSPNKLATTNNTNAIIDYIKEAFPGFKLGDGAQRRGFFPAVCVIADAEASGGGFYTGKIIARDLRFDIAVDLAAPGTSDTQDIPCIIANWPEAGTSTHDLDLDIPLVGIILGTVKDSPMPVVVVGGGGASTCTPGEDTDTLRTDTERFTADATEYDPADGNNLHLWVVTGEGYDETAGTPGLKVMLSKLSWPKCYAPIVSGETLLTVFSTTLCGTGNLDFGSY